MADQLVLRKFAQPPRRSNSKRASMRSIRPPRIISSGVFFPPKESGVESRNHTRAWSGPLNARCRSCSNSVSCVSLVRASARGVLSLSLHRKRVLSFTPQMSANSLQPSFSFDAASSRTPRSTSAVVAVAICSSSFIQYVRGDRAFARFVLGLMPAPIGAVLVS